MRERRGRRLIVGLGALLAAFVVGCGSSSSDATPNAGATSESTPTASPAAAAATPPAAAPSPPVVTATAEPGMEDAMSRDQLIALGKEVYDRPGSCTTCHKPDGSGLIGPNVQGKSADQIRLMLDTNEAMMGIIISEREIDAVAVYLQTLLPE